MCFGAPAATDSLQDQRDEHHALIGARTLSVLVRALEVLVANEGGTRVSRREVDSVVAQAAGDCQVE